MSRQDPSSAYQRAMGQSAGGGYKATPALGTPTQTEAWALIEAARRMAEVLETESLDDLKARHKLRDALRLNWRLWTIFQAQLTTDGEGVPEDLRINMLTLCQFVDKHTVETMTDMTPEKVIVLINLNREIASGLFESLKAQASQSEQPETDTNGEDASKKSFSFGV